MAVLAPLTGTISATSLSICETLTIELQTLGFTAIAASSNLTKVIRLSFSLVTFAHYLVHG